MSELKPFDEFMDALVHCDTVKVILTGCGESAFETKPIYEGICALANRRAQPSNEPLTLDELREMLERLEMECQQASDGHEDYTNGYRWGHRNGQIELLRQILNTGEGTCESDHHKPEGSAEK